MDFNKDIQELLTPIVEKMISQAIEGNGDGKVLSVTLARDYHDEGDPESFVSQIGDKSTCWNHLVYQVTILNPQGQVEELESTLDIPYQMQGGVFIVDGRTRIATNSLETEYDCYYNLNGERGPRFQLNGVMYYTHVKGKKGIEEPGFVAEWTDEDYTNKRVQFINQKQLEELGVDLSISEEQRQKLNYLLDVPFEDLGVVVKNKLTYDLLEKLKSPEKSLDSRVDGPVNLKIYDVPHALIRFIRDQTLNKEGKPTKNYSTALNSIKRAWVKQHIINLSGLMGAVLRFLRNPSNEDVDIATVVNPLVFDQLHGKITMKSFLPYSRSYADIIDAPNTPENGNVNRINELNVCIENIGGNIYIKCYTFPDGEPTVIPYYQYTNSRVLRSEEWDYDNHTILEEKSKYKIKYHTNTKEVSAGELKSVSFIEPKIDDRFSLSSRTIPFLNCSDHVRVAINIPVA